MASGQSECKCADCGVEITGVPIIPAAADGPTRAQVEKLKPTVYLCVECARERGFSFTDVVLGEDGSASGSTG
jgi:DNA-directed RNA polymerase subunit RPC12/RpoP